MSGRSVKGRRAAPPHAARYPWARWFAGPTITLRRGWHFAGLPHGFAQTARQAAARMGVAVSVEVGSDSVTLRVVK